MYKWRKGTYVVAQSGDECHVESWVFFRDCPVSFGPLNTLFMDLCALKESIRIGCITELWIPEGSRSSMAGLVTMETFELGDILHPEFDMPVLRRSEITDLVTVHSEVGGT
jgi:hypothetical protein